MLKSGPNSEEIITRQQIVMVVAPILPGKVEAWRRFMQELLGSRRGEYEASRHRLGIRVERAWISETRHRAIGIMMIEADHLEETLATLATSAHPFDYWFREQLRILQGIDLTRPDSTFLPHLVFAWRDDERG